MRIASMLFCTSLVALVGYGELPALSPRLLSIVNTKRETTITQMHFLDTILAVRLNRKRIVVVLQEKIHIYDITTMKEIHTIETPSNPKGTKNSKLDLLQPCNFALIMQIL
jgi:autophagy-related protein 18